MFRIDRTLVSYDRSVSEYTGIGTVLNSAENLTVKNVQCRAKEEVPEHNQELAQLRLGEAEKKAREILAEAKEKARDLIEKAEAEAEEILKEAEERGYREGADRAERENALQYNKKLEALSELIDEAGAARKAMLDELEDDIISLVMDIAKKVINIELEKNDKAFVGLVHNALGQMKREGKIVIRVGPEEYSRFFSAGCAEFLLNNEYIRATVVEEPMFERGDCVIDSEGGTVNAGVNSQFKHIEFAFRNDESFIA
ncbi:MAG: FliH/SctL family protein [Oscillospiraceae bacterium]